jgi:DNA-binding response OmpR family regulator
LQERWDHEGSARAGTRETRQRVLVVEDDESVARMLHIALGAAGFDAMEARSGSEALDIVGREAPDAVILDLVLPDGLGGSVLDWLREAPSDTAPVHLVMSALERREATGLFGELGNDFIQKPFDPWDLVRRLDQLLESKGTQRREGKRS